MIPKLENTRNKRLPNEVLPCMYVDKQAMDNLLKSGGPFVADYTTSEYFKVVERSGISDIEGYLGRTDQQIPFFEDFDPAIAYFIAYREGKEIHFTFDKTHFFKVSHILPYKPLLFILTKVNLTTMTEENINKSVSQTTINAGKGNVITTGNSNTVNVYYNILKGNLEKLKEELVEHHVSSDDIEEITTIVKQEQLDQTGRLPAKANSWISKMVQKSLDGIWDVGVHVAGGLLVEILKGYYGIS